VLATERIDEIIKEHRRKDGDTGSPEVQIALLTERITGLTEHLKFHKKDHHSRRGLLLLVSQRKSLQDYYKRRNPEGHQALIGKLGLRR